MINKTNIEELIAGFISEKDIFLVSVSVSTGNQISVLIDKKSGITIQECVLLSKHIEGSLDREQDDFELQVSSPGLGEAFQVAEQYEMNLGKKVSVVDNEGNKFNGTLTSYNGETFSIETTRKAKGKKRELIDKAFSVEETRSVKVKISFK